MTFIKFFSLLFFSNVLLLQATEFTVASYNCGGLTQHYDYLRAACMEKLMQERYIAEPEEMATIEKIQQVALKILFSQDPKEKRQAQEEWDQKNYQKLSEQLTTNPANPDSPNNLWYNKIEQMITSYRVRPISINDEKVNQRLDEHLSELSQIKTSRQKQLDITREIMAKRILTYHLSHDIICLQEADYLKTSFFPENYEILFTQNEHSKNGIAWNKDRFEMIQFLGDILGRALAVKLRDKETGKLILIASGHLTGCNPFQGDFGSAKGDTELHAIIDLFNIEESDLRIIGIDSNVTSLHPRLKILKDANYQIDCYNYLEQTCSSPYQILGTRIDWIALQTNLEYASITNIPILSVGLNNIQTNISDHKPIAAKINY